MTTVKEYTTPPSVAHLVGELQVTIGKMHQFDLNIPGTIELRRFSLTLETQIQTLALLKEGIDHEIGKRYTPEKQG